MNTPSPIPEAARLAAETITAALLREHVVALSSEAMEGRGPASAGGERAMQYLQDQLAQLGYQPGAPNGTWRQPFDMVGITSTPPELWRFSSGQAELFWNRRDEFVVGSGRQAAEVDLHDAELVFAGYGIEAPEYGWNDFKGENLHGKVLLLINSDPDWDPELFAGKTRLHYGRWGYKYESAARQGAVGAIIVHTTESAGYPFQVVQSSLGGERFALPASGDPLLPIQGWATEHAARALIAFAGKDFDGLLASARSRDFRPVPLGVTTSVHIDNAVRRVQTGNVIGVLPGTDPLLREQAVVYTAHHDHLGIGEPDAHGARIRYGALDNGAGMAQLLGVAKAMRALPAAPRRSTVILFVGAEEQGLLGSRHYCAHPTVSPGRIAANINYDDANIWGRTHDITLIGKGKSNIDGVVEDLARYQGRRVEGDHFPDRGFYYRSDQFSFARIGVPAAYFNSGIDFMNRPAGWGRTQIEAFEAERYHQPSDVYDESWNFEGMIEDARLGFWTGLAIAQAEALPTWTPGDEFEPARRAALAAERSDPGKSAR